MDTKPYVFQEQLGTGLISNPAGWKEIDDWFEYAKSLPTIEDEMESLINSVSIHKVNFIIFITIRDKNNFGTIG